MTKSIMMRFEVVVDYVMQNMETLVFCKAILLSFTQTSFFCSQLCVFLHLAIPVSEFIDRFVIKILFRMTFYMGFRNN